MSVNLQRIVLMKTLKDINSDIMTLPQNETTVSIIEQLNELSKIFVFIESNARKEEVNRAANIIESFISNENNLKSIHVGEDEAILLQELRNVITNN